MRRKRLKLMHHLQNSNLNFFKNWENKSETALKALDNNI